MNEDGFTLLEVLVAVVILATALVVLLDIQSNYIKRIDTDYQKLEALEFFKRDFYGMGKEEGKFIVKTEKETLPFDIKQVKNKIIDKNTGKEILTIITYER